MGLLYWLVHIPWASVFADAEVRGVESTAGVVLTCAIIRTASHTAPLPTPAPTQFPRRLSIRRAVRIAAVHVASRAVISAISRADASLISAVYRATSSAAAFVFCGRLNPAPEDRRGAEPITGVLGAGSTTATVTPPMPYPVMPSHGCRGGGNRWAGILAVCDMLAGTSGPLCWWDCPLCWWVALYNSGMGSHDGGRPRGCYGVAMGLAWLSRG